MSEAVDHPAHYGGADNPYEVIKVAEAWGFDKDAYLFNVLKYIARPGKGNYLEDLKKARFYLDRKIAKLEGFTEPSPPNVTYVGYSGGSAPPTSVHKHVFEKNCTPDCPGYSYPRFGDGGSQRD